MYYKLDSIIKEKFFVLFFVSLFAYTINVRADNPNYPLEKMDITSIIDNKPFTPGISLTKSANTLDGLGATGGCAFIEYTFTVTNESDSGEILENVVIVDDFLGAIAQAPNNDMNNDGVMDPGEIWDYTVLYQITQNDLDNGLVDGTAEVTADVQGGGAVNIQSNDLQIDLTHCQSAIALVKRGAFLLLPDAEPRCDALLFVFTVTNQGTEPLEDIVITDPLLGGAVQGPQSGDDNNSNTLDPNEAWIYQIQYDITQADKVKGEIENQATVTATIENTNLVIQDFSDDNSIFEDDPTVIDISHCPPSSIALIKNGAYLLLPDAEPRCDALLYVFTVTNQGPEPLEDIVITDPLLGGVVPGPQSGDDNNSNTLDPNEAWIYQIQYDITQADINLGEIVNQATVTATIENTNIEIEDLSDDDSIFEDDPTIMDVSSCQNPSIGLIKEGTVIDVDADGCMDSILYTFTVTNTGDVDLVDITVEDPLFGGVIPGPVDGTDIGNDGILSVGETWTYEAVYAITQTDIDNQSVINQATVTAVSFANIPVSDLSDNDSLLEDDPTRTPVPDDACTDGPNIGLVKEGVLVDTNADGCLDSIRYTFTVTNTGGSDLDAISLTDFILFGIQDIPGPISESITENDILEIGETWIYEADYAITQTDIDNQSVVNQATVSGEVVNTEISVFDLSDDDSLLEDDPTRTPVPDDACTDGPNIGLIKEGVLVDTNADGCLDSIRYTFTVTNTGGSDLDAISLTDFILFGNQDIPGPISESITENDILEIGETWIYEANYAITQTDIDNQSVVNQATVSGEVVNTEISVFDLSDDDSLLEDEPTRTFIPDSACTDGPNIGLIKEGVLVDTNADGCLDSIRYTFTVTNTGGSDLDAISLTDFILFGNQDIPGPISESITENDILEIGETWIYEADYAITQTDIDNQSVVNQATVSGEVVNTEISVLDLSDDDSLLEDESTRTIIPDDACPGDDGTPLYGIAVIKTGEGVDADFDGCDDSINYSFSVINSGILNLENIVLEDELLGGSINTLVNTEQTEDGILQPGEEWLFTATYNLIQEDIDGIFVDNQAIVTADIVDSSDSILDRSDDNSYEENDFTSINVSNFCEFIGGGSGFQIFNGITPNGDGMNDYFKILGIENYPDNNVKIFNRWGVLVYQTDNYGQGSNLFFGISEGRATLQSERELPSGTYFYILTFTSDENPGEESYSGYLYINRD